MTANCRCLPLAVFALALVACQPAAPDPAPVAPTERSLAAVPTLSPAGYDGMAIGQPASAASHGFVEDGGYDGSCRTWGSQQMPSAYLLAEDGVLQRITVTQGHDGIPDSPVRTDRGIGIGDPVDKVRAAYPGLRESPHQYVDGLYLDWLPQGDDKPGLRFETADGKVTDIHAGRPPALFYIEGCS